MTYCRFSDDHVWSVYVNEPVFSDFQWTWSFNSLRRVTHLCVGKLIIIGSDNGLSPGRRQAIIWTNAGIWSMRPLRINLSEILIEIHTFFIQCANKTVFSVFQWTWPSTSRRTSTTAEVSRLPPGQWTTTSVPTEMTVLSLTRGPTRGWLWTWGHTGIWRKSTCLTEIRVELPIISAFCWNSSNVGRQDWCRANYWFLDWAAIVGDKSHSWTLIRH